MKILNIIAAISLFLFIGCGGGETDEQQTETGDADVQQQEAESGDTEDVRTIEIIGVDQMKFVVEENQEGIGVGDPVNDDLLLLESITVQPGERVRIVLITQSQLPASAMAHNWLLLSQDADVQAFANAAARAKDNDYVPSDMSDQIIAQTGLAAGDETTEVTFTAPDETGTYEYLCTFPGHFGANMRGDLIVQESADM